MRYSIVASILKLFSHVVHEHCNVVDIHYFLAFFPKWNRHYLFENTLTSRDPYNPSFGRLENLLAALAIAAEPCRNSVVSM